MRLADGVEQNERRLDRVTLKATGEESALMATLILEGDATGQESERC